MKSEFFQTSVRWWGRRCRRISTRKQTLDSLAEGFWLFKSALNFFCDMDSSRIWTRKLKRKVQGRDISGNYTFFPWSYPECAFLSASLPFSPTSHTSETAGLTLPLPPSSQTTQCEDDRMRLSQMVNNYQAFQLISLSVVCMQVSSCENLILWMARTIWDVLCHHLLPKFL